MIGFGVIRKAQFHHLSFGQTTPPSTHTSCDVIIVYRDFSSTIKRAYYRPGRPYQGRFLTKRIDQVLMNDPWISTRRKVEWLGPRYVRHAIPDPPQASWTLEKVDSVFLSENASLSSRSCITIALNRANIENALDLIALRRLNELIFKYTTNQLYTCVIWKALDVSCQNVCTNTNLYYLYTLLGREQGIQSIRAYYQELQKSAFYLSTTTKPILVFMTGDVVGAAAGLALNAMIPITTESARIAATGCAIGLIGCEAGLSYRFSRLPNHLGEYLLLSGRTLEDADLIHTTLSDHFVPSDRIQVLQNKLSQMPQDIASQDLISSIAHLNEPLNESSIHHVIDAIDYCFSKPTLYDIVKSLKSMINQVDQVEQMAWAKSTLERMEKHCPLSMALTLRATRLARYLPMSQCLQMEYSLIARMVQSSYFYEGLTAFVESRVIDWQKLEARRRGECSRDELKDEDWIYNFSPELIDSYFTPLDKESRLKLDPISPECQLVNRKPWHPNSNTIFKNILKKSSPSSNESLDNIQDEEFIIDPEEWGGAFSDYSKVLQVAREKIISGPGIMTYHSLLNREEQLFDVIEMLRNENMTIVNHTNSN